MARVVGSLVVFLTRPGLVCFVPAVVVLFLTDYFDGIIARTQNRETVFGKWADPLADKLLLLVVVDYLLVWDPGFWQGVFLPLLWPELLLALVGAALVLVDAPVTPRPVIWGRLKFALYFLAVVAFLLGQSAAAKVLLGSGIAFAYLAAAAYAARGYREHALGRLQVSSE
ncbi:MAG: CDP-alcohol phosphatidyltransferase family protein [Thermoanaerobaculaceae bacterium]